MADNGYRTFRRDTLARDEDASPQDGPSDPLAELARIIGQSDPHGGQPRDNRQPEAFDDHAPVAGTDWASSDDSYADEHYPPEPGYAKQGYSKSGETYRSDSADPHSWSNEPEYPDDPPPMPSARPFAPPPLPLNDTRDDTRRYGGLQDVRPRDDRSKPLPYLPPVSEGHKLPERQQLETPAQPYTGDYAEEEYADEGPPVRRSGTIIIVALLGLAVVGTASALGYRAMFGHSVLPSLPPIIRPGEGPIKIVPSHQAQAPAGDPNRAGPQVVPHQEQPVDLPPAARTPRVITTIPVVSNSPDSLPEASQPAMPQAPGMAPAPAPGAAPPPGPAFPSPNQPSQPPSRGVHTLTIRPQEAPGADDPPPQPQAAAPARAPVTRPARTHEPAVRPHRPTRETASGPMSIVPGQNGDVRPPPRTRVATAAPVRTRPVSALVGGGFSVQVSSQRSEAEAQAAFRSLQAKYPQQLGGRHPVVRRADLGAKGVYYRAMVGPFGSGEQASGLCNSIRAAGGSCIIQRN